MNGVPAIRGNIMYFLHFSFLGKYGWHYAAVLLLLFMASGGAVQAQNAPLPFVDELRLGAYVHDVESLHGDNDVDLNAEILFPKLWQSQTDDFLSSILTPRPHIGMTQNFEGETSEYYFGLTWDVPLGEFAFLEGSFGGAFHDGPLDHLGCRLNFHETASLGFKLGDHWRLLGTISHMSNANLCNVNKGLTNAGLRLGYKF